MALNRIAEWRKRYRESVAACEGADGILPKHTFFYPVEQYEPVLLDRIAELCAETGCETEIHLHHEHDTAAGVRAKLEEGRDRLASHGLLGRDRSGRIRYGFIHGNWALDHSHPRGKACGVPDEIGVLSETGCYADFTMPSAPDRCQTRTINAVYYATCTPAAKSHDRGAPARLGARPNRALLVIQGPLGLNWRRRKFGILPRIENGDLTGTNPPTADRLRLWLEICPQVVGCDEWVFIKLHTHGGIERNLGMLLGEPMRAFRKAALSCGIPVHWVSAREMANLVRAAEDGLAGDPAPYRDYHILPPRLR